MAIFKIHHITKYEYNKPVKESCNEIKIFPYLCNEQEILNHELIITNHPEVYIYTDYWKNKIGLFNLLLPHKELVVESKLTVRTTLPSLLSFDFHPDWQDLQNEVNGNLQLLELATHDIIESQQKIHEIIAQLEPHKKTVTATVESCNAFIFNQFKYIKGITDIETTVDEILNVSAGVCQDFAHLMLQILRTLKIPSRYVSGYICPNKNGMRGEGATHAWVEVYISGYGWAGIDPTNNIWVTNNHVKLAVGKNFSECTPVKGTFKGPALQTLSVYVSVGYEDGQVFEEVNKVQMLTHATDKAQVQLDEFYEQQQQ